MKILIIVTKGEIGGAQVSVLNLAKGLKEKVISSGENRTTLPERIIYNIQGREMQQILFMDNVKDAPMNSLQISISGKGPDEKAAQKDARNNAEAVVKVLIDK